MIDLSYVTCLYFFYKKISYFSPLYIAKRPISVQQKEIIPIVFIRNMCIKVENQPCFSKSLLLITTEWRIRKKQMDKKAVFYDAVLAPQDRKQFV